MGKVPDGLIAPVEGPDGTKGGRYGYWALKPAGRPYAGLGERDLDDWQREAVRLWEKSPFNMVWCWQVEPGPENDWAGWGPPPPGFRTRRDIPRTPEGAYLGAAVPWPPAGEPR